MEKLNYTNAEFIEKLADALGDNFFLCDMIWQDELHEMQSKIADLICDYANNGNRLARRMTLKLSETFNTELV